MPPAIPSLIFDNRTAFDALHFDTVDQNDVAFHVIVARTAYTLGPAGADGVATMTALEEPAQLNTADRHYDDDTAHSVREESDLAPYKPLCDVIVICDAHAPGGRAARRFSVGLHVKRPDTRATLPERPLGLNPMQGPSPAMIEEWENEVRLARNTVVPGQVLLDKTLAVTGPRTLRKRFAPVRLAQWGIRLATLGLANPSPWRLTRPSPTLSVPLRYELAQGGECRINTSSPDAKRVPLKFRLAHSQAAAYPPGGAPAALDACQWNPVGLGFARPWFLRATGNAGAPAPQVAYPARPFSAAQFWSAAKGKAELHPAGLGAVGRAWLPRRNWIGTFEVKAQWQADAIPRLPKDFDFRYWNCAPADQQCPHLKGEEIFTLLNLCASDSLLARKDTDGNTVLRFALPAQSLFALGADTAGAVAVMPLAIDTVTIDLEAGQVHLTWRLCMLADGELPEVRLMHCDSAEQLRRIDEWNAPSSGATPVASPLHSAPTPL
ncbi:DUF2169 domain-containing protein [Massilia sp. DJPM01]|uniref:DUF2169 family type VI secretion system accessory protein n=1 Tax=Massilia sp. DJPM01 TaxID=3024404 RepID=UPI00259F9A20|nr:DUF2169 domain-containing protein [Massilia sp. DJPM01]MDM5175614.1 DUF2169 domain-containing protein [Massilia sp. DJPM01]